MFQYLKQAAALTAVLGFLYTKTQTQRFDDYGVLDGKLGDLQIYADIQVIVQVLGNGKNNNADALIEETIRSECNFGYTKDRSKAYGEGLGQFDRIAFDDVKDRTKENTKSRLKKIGVDLDTIEYEDLRKSPMASIAFIRLKYLLVTASIPQTREARWDYYKKWYNSVKGAATYSHFMAAQDGNYYV